MRITPPAVSALSLLIAASLMSGACSKDQKAPAQGPGGAAQSRQAAGDGAVRLLPEKPTAQDDIRAVHSGGRQVAYRWFINSQLVAGENGPVLPAGGVAKGDRVSVTVTLDGQETSVSATVENSLPKITSVTFSNPQAPGAGIAAEPKVFDADGDPVWFRFQWAVNGGNLPDAGPSVPGSRFRKGDQVSITVTPYDSSGDGEPYASLPLVIPNAPPRFISPPEAEFSASGYRYHARAEDPDGDPLTYSLATAPPGMVIDSRTGMVTWALADARPGQQMVEVVVRDPEGLKAVQQYTLTVTPPQEVKDEKK